MTPGLVWGYAAAVGVIAWRLFAWRGWRPAVAAVVFVGREITKIPDMTNWTQTFYENDVGSPSSERLYRHSDYLVGLDPCPKTLHRHAKNQSAALVYGGDKWHVYFDSKDFGLRKPFFSSDFNFLSTFFTSSLGGRRSGRMPRSINVLRTLALLVMCSPEISCSVCMRLTLALKMVISAAKFLSTARRFVAAGYATQTRILSADNISACRSKRASLKTAAIGFWSNRKSGIFSGCTVCQ